MLQLLQDACAIRQREREHKASLDICCTSTGSNH